MPVKKVAIPKVPLAVREAQKAAEEAGFAARQEASNKELAAHAYKAGWDAHAAEVARIAALQPEPVPEKMGFWKTWFGPEQPER